MRYFSLGEMIMSFVLEGKMTIDVSSIEEIATKIKSVSISTLQGEIRHLAEQILKDLAHADWPAGKASKGYVSTGELADAVVVTGSGTSLNIEMDGSRMSMVAPVHGSGVSNRNAVSHFPKQWGIHMGVKGQAYNTEMPALLEYGGGGLVPHEGTGYFEKAFGIYQEEFIHILAEALRSAGFEVSEG